MIRKLAVRHSLRRNRLRTQSQFGYRPALEPLEERALLSVNDLLISTFDSTHGMSVVRYNELTQLPVPGGVATSLSFNTAQGLAVAPDGSYYVSSLGTGNIQHFSRQGTFLDVLGSSDGTPAPVAAPGALRFGPDGLLYEGEVNSPTINVFDVNNLTQQYQTSINLVYFPPGPPGPPDLIIVPGAITFSSDPSHSLVVGNLNGGGIFQFDTGLGNRPSTILADGSGINPGSILPETNGKYLVADFAFATQEASHHQIVEVNPATHTFTQWVNLDQPEGTGDTAGDPAQPLSLLYDHDGNLLVGVSPDHNGNGAVLKFNISTKALMDTVVSGIGTPTGLAFIAPVASDLISSVFDFTSPESVLRFNNVTNAPMTGVPTSAGFNTAQGLAVAPDGTFYVSSLGTGQIQHYAADGTFIGILGAGDGTPAPVSTPGALIFGPDGLLYEGEVTSPLINVFDVNNPTQKYQTSINTVYFPPGDPMSPDLVIVPGALAFSRDGNHNLIVGNLTDQGIYVFDNGHNNRPSIVLGPGSGINPGSILPEANGKLLVADFAFQTQEAFHHQIVEVDPATHTYTQWVNLDQPEGTGDTAGDPAQPLTLLYDQNGNLLVGVSPDHNSNGAIQRYNINTHALMETVAGNLGTPSGLAWVPTQQITVAARKLFYDNSKYDGNAPGPSANDDVAIATDKTAYLPGTGAVTFASVSSYTKGVNGLMFDIYGPHGTITADDFQFFTGNNNSPSTWATFTHTPVITIRGGAGDKGADRVEITWPAGNAPTKGWLEVVVKANSDTGLAQKAGYPVGQGDVFFWGNAVGDTGAGDTLGFVTNTNDEIGARQHPAAAALNIPTTNIYDFNRDGKVDSTDQIIARNNLNAVVTAPKIINIGSPPLAPSVDEGISSALAVPSAAAASGSSSTGAALSGDSDPNARSLAKGENVPALLHAAIERAVADDNALASVLDLDEGLLGNLIAGRRRK